MTQPRIPIAAELLQEIVNVLGGLAASAPTGAQGRTIRHTLNDIEAECVAHDNAERERAGATRRARRPAPSTPAP